jgi:hypothetical protein
MIDYEVLKDMSYSDITSLTNDLQSNNILYSIEYCPYDKDYIERYYGEDRYVDVLVKIYDEAYNSEECKETKAMDILGIKEHSADYIKRLLELKSFM